MKDETTSVQPRARRTRTHQLTAEGVSAFETQVAEVEAHPELARASARASTLEPLIPGITRLRKLHMSFPLIAKTISDSTGLKFSPTYLSSYLKRRSAK